MKFFKFFAFLAVSSMCFISCSKEDDLDGLETPDKGADYANIYEEDVPKPYSAGNDSGTATPEF